jgi:glycosyltransferase involved in cell wall biosynthesis
VSPTASRLRVLHVTPYFAPAFSYGGPPRSILGLCQGLLQAGADVEVLTTTANGDAPPLPPEPDGFTVEGVRARYFPLAAGARFFRAPRLAACLRAQLQACDIVHIHGLWNWPSWTAARECARAGVPYVISPRGMLETPALQHRRLRKKLLYPLVAKGSLQGAAFLHATAPPERDTLLRLGFARVVLLPNGVPGLIDRANLAGRMRVALRIGAATPLITWLGRIHQIKRLDLLLAAFAQLRRRADAHLAIAGPDEAGLRSQLDKLVQGSANAVHWLGAVDGERKAELLADSDVLVMCSDSESFGMSVVEALAAGVPAVVTDTCPWQELESAGCGRSVPQDAPSLAAAILSIISAPESTAAMRQSARRLVAEKYLWKAIAERMLERYAEVTVVTRSRAAAARA